MAEKVVEEEEKAGGVGTGRVSDNTRQSGRSARDGAARVSLPLLFLSRKKDTNYWNIGHKRHSE